MNDSSCLVADSLASSGVVPASQALELPRRPKPEISQLLLSTVWEHRYWPEVKSGMDGPRPSVLISTNIFLTGGFAVGMKLGLKADISLRFIDEFGREFECLYAPHRPWRVVAFMGRGYVRVRMFSDFTWRATDASPSWNAAFRACVLLEVADNARHSFVFPVTPELRWLFPTAPAEVT